MTLKFTTHAWADLALALYKPGVNTYLVDSEGRQYFAVAARHIGTIDDDKALTFEYDRAHNKLLGEAWRLYPNETPVMFQIVVPHFPQTSDEVSVVVLFAYAFPNSNTGDTSLNVSIPNIQRK